MVDEIQRTLKQSKPFANTEEAVFVGIQVAAEQAKSSFNEVFKTHELTGAQYNVLRILRGAGDSGLSCREIGERMISRDSDITRMLDRLEGRGLIVRERQSDDRRVVITVISNEGLGVLEDLEGPLMQLQREKLSHMSKAELRTLAGLLDKAVEKLT